VPFEFSVLKMVSDDDDPAAVSCDSHQGIIWAFSIARGRGEA